PPIETAATRVPGLSEITTLSLGGLHACAVRTDGTALCWGNNGRGFLGDGTTLSRYEPAPVSGLTDATLVAVGGVSSIAIRAAGTLVRWGTLVTDFMPRLSPIPFSTVTDAVDIDVGMQHGCLLDRTFQLAKITHARSLARAYGAGECPIRGNSAVHFNSVTPTRSRRR
ncbi:MAG: RCC1 domain-containing protein, partial [Deltaproteobacteria bacterium]